MLNINKAEELNTYNPKGYKTYEISHNNGSSNAPKLETVVFRNSHQSLLDGKFCNQETFVVSLATKLGISTSSIKLVK